jgi:outer membrane lipoprotein-sorting protein
MRLHHLIILSFLLAAGIILPRQSAAQSDASKQLEAAYQKITRAKDYTADARITTDIPLLRILPVQAKIYFKQPDKFKVESNSIFVLPTQGFNNISKVMQNKTAFTSVQSHTEKIGNILTNVINVIPTSDTGQLLLARFWIDPATSLVYKSQLTSRNNGTVVMEYTYGTNASYGLPDKIVVSLDVPNIRIPKSMTSDTRKSSKKKQPEPGTFQKGTITIEFSKYQINKGLKDETFVEEKK